VDQWASDGRIQVFYNDPTQLLCKALCCIKNWD